MNSRIDITSDKDKLWELYLHTLAGFHGNLGANDGSNKVIAEKAHGAAEAALKVWKDKVIF